MGLGRIPQSVEGRAQKALFRAAERYRGRIIAREGDSGTAGGNDVMKKEWSVNQIYEGYLHPERTCIPEWGRIPRTSRGTIACNSTSLLPNNAECNS